MARSSKKSKEERPPLKKKVKKNAVVKKAAGKKSATEKRKIKPAKKAPQKAVKTTRKPAGAKAVSKKKTQKKTPPGPAKKAPVKSRQKPVSRAAVPFTPRGLAIAAATLNVQFTSGLGQLSAIVFRNGVEIDSDSITQTGSIIFEDVAVGDSISVSGECSGTTTITIDVGTNPATPTVFTEHVFDRGYTVTSI